MQPRGALVDSTASPLPIQSFSSRLYRIVDQIFIGFRNLRDDAAVRGIHVGKFTLAAHKFAVYEIEDWFHEAPCFTCTGNHSRGIVTGDNYPSIAAGCSIASLPEISLESILPTGHLDGEALQA